jgi:hypothetical protein
MYTTSDLYVAAALVVNTGIKPDAFQISKSADRKKIVNVVWNNRDLLEPIVSQVKTGQTTVNLTQFRETHLALKRNVRDTLKQSQEKMQ